MPKNTHGFGIVPVLLGLVLVAGITGVGWYVWNKQNKENPPITNYEECVAAGNPVMESYPEQCAANGQTFTRELTDEEKKKLVPPAEPTADI